MLEPLLGGYSSMVWLLLLSDVDCWWCSLDCVDFLKSGCGTSHCSLSICLWYFYFKKVHGPTPSIFDFTGFSSVVPNVTLEVQYPLLLLKFLGNISHNLLAHPWCSLASIPSSLPALVFFWMLCSVFSGSSWARLLGVSLVFFGTLSEWIMGSPLCAYRSSIINNQIWIYTFSWYFFSSYWSFCVLLLLFLVQKSKSQSGRKIEHTLQKLRYADSAASFYYDHTRTINNHTPTSIFESKSKEAKSKFWL